MDPNQMMDGGRSNMHVVNQLDLDEEWMGMSPQRDDLKLLCEQNVSIVCSVHWKHLTCKQTERGVVGTKRDTCLVNVVCVLFRRRRCPLNSSPSTRLCLS